MPTEAKKAVAPPPADSAALINTRQMRQLHALLRDHGISGDSAVHTYIATALEELGDTPVESRTELTATQATRLIADLEGAEVAEVHTVSTRNLNKLRAEFPPEAVGKLPKSTCRACSDSPRKRCDEHTWISNCPECHGRHSSATMHIDYVGHADVTARLLEVDPLWTWEPAMRDQHGQPSIAASIDRDGNLWINLTVLGVTRPGVGDGKNAKERIGDALRNAAMRFGVALDLWAKGDRDWAHTPKEGTDQHPDQQAARAPQADPAPAPYAGPTTAELLAMIDSHAERAGITREQITAKWREQHGGLSVEALETLEPQHIAPLEQQIAEYLLANPPAAAGA